MKFLRTYRIVFAFSTLPVLLFQNSSCTKEYSYEGGDTLNYHHDSLAEGGPVGEYPFCTLCHPSDPLNLGTWRFNARGSYLCGGTTNSGYIGGNSRRSFTLFGPSSCSIDTGIVISVYLSVPLDRNRQNLTTDDAAFYYYDHNSPYDIFDSDLSRGPFTVTVTSYDYSTGVTIGTFSGMAFKPNGDTVYVSGGKYKVLVKM